jgi:hypothetical protein
MIAMALEDLLVKYYGNHVYFWIETICTRSQTSRANYSTGTFAAIKVMIFRWRQFAHALKPLELTIQWVPL